MVFNPEDEQDFGPHCRNCHKGASRCSTCHTGGAYTSDPITGSNNTAGKSIYTMAQTSDGQPNPIGASTLIPGFDSLATSTKLGFYKKSRTVEYPDDWRMSGDDMGEPGALTGDASCSDDGFSWPHRTLGWKMLKDDLFGLDFNGGLIGVGGTRTYSDGTTTTTLGPAHDIDSVCLDCHNPTVWNDGQVASKDGHVDDPNNTSDNHNDELLTRGLP